MAFTQAPSGRASHAEMDAADVPSARDPRGHAGARRYAPTPLTLPTNVVGFRRAGRPRPRRGPPGRWDSAAAPARPRRTLRELDAVVADLRAELRFSGSVPVSHWIRQADLLKRQADQHHIDGDMEQQYLCLAKCDKLLSQLMPNEHPGWRKLDDEQARQIHALLELTRDAWREMYDDDDDDGPPSFVDSVAPTPTLLTPVLSLPSASRAAPRRSSLRCAESNDTSPRKKVAFAEPPMSPEGSPSPQGRRSPAWRGRARRPASPPLPREAERPPSPAPARELASPVALEAAAAPRHTLLARMRSFKISSDGRGRQAASEAPVSPSGPAATAPPAARDAAPLSPAATSAAAGGERTSLPLDEHATTSESSVRPARRWRMDSYRPRLPRLSSRERAPERKVLTADPPVTLVVTAPRAAGAESPTPRAPGRDGWRASTAWPWQRGASERGVAPSPAPTPPPVAAPPARATTDAPTSARADPDAAARADPNAAAPRAPPPAALRTLELPTTLADVFLRLAEPATRASKETCGLLLGRGDAHTLRVTHLVLPPQHGTDSSCVAEGEEQVLAFQLAEDLYTLGWIHTHPSQSCFLSSLDLHTHASYQALLPEAVAVVCAPQHTPSIGVFRLTDPPGLTYVLQCDDPAPFHPHGPDDAALYVDASALHGRWRGTALEVHDWRTSTGSE